MSNLWKLTDFKLIPFCNTYSLHALQTEQELHTVVVDITGVLHWLNRLLAIDLKQLLDETERELDSFSLELVASDTALSPKEDLNSFAYLATCWVVYDRLFAPERYFAVFFRILRNLEVDIWNKFDLKGAPTFTRLTITSPMNTNHMYWLIFSYSKGVLGFFIDHDKQQVKPVEAIGDAFPSLEIGHIPGSAIRSHCWVSNNYRFSVVGYDTGYVIATVCTMQSGSIIDRKTIKFSGPISVLRLVNQNDDELTTSVVVSSTLGPAAIWTLKLDDEILLWEMNTILLNSEIYDAVITCSVSRHYIFIGTYGEQLLVYNTGDILNSEFCEVFPFFVLNIASPIISVVFVESKRLLLVLSYKGIHTFSACSPPHEMLVPMFVPNSPIQTPTEMLFSPTSYSFGGGTKSPMVSPSVEASPQAVCQLEFLPTINPSTSSLQRGCLKPQSHSLPHSSSSKHKLQHQKQKARPHLSFNTVDQICDDSNRYFSVKQVEHDAADSGLSNQNYNLSK